MIPTLVLTFTLAAPTADIPEPGPTKPTEPMAGTAFCVLALEACGEKIGRK